MKYDVAVIGAGPAGAFAAEKLSSFGYKILIIDPSEKKKVCAGILTSQYARRYRINESFVERELKGVKISFRDITAEITYRKAIEYSINRESYDSFNLGNAIGGGCEFKKDKVLTVNEKDSFVDIRTKKEHILSDYVIIASGISELSRALRGAKKYAFCVQRKIDQKPGDYFEMELQRCGYSWVSPKKDYVLKGTSSITRYPNMPGEKGLIPLEPAKKTFSGRTLLAGDAAGFVSPFEGEGIYHARRSGELAAEVLSDAISGENRLDIYEKKWKKEFDFSILKKLSMLLSNGIILEAFVREIRDNEKFNKLVEDILTKEKKIQIKDISLIKSLL